VIVHEQLHEPVRSPTDFFRERGARGQQQNNQYRPVNCPTDVCLFITFSFREAEKRVAAFACKLLDIFRVQNAAQH